MKIATKLLILLLGVFMLMDLGASEGGVFRNIVKRSAQGGPPGGQNGPPGGGPPGGGPPGGGQGGPPGGGPPGGGPPGGGQGQEGGSQSSSSK